MEEIFAGDCSKDRRLTESKCSRPNRNYWENYLCNTYWRSYFDFEVTKDSKNEDIDRIVKYLVDIREIEKTPSDTEKIEQTPSAKPIDVEEI